MFAAHLRLPVIPSPADRQQVCSKICAFLWDQEGGGREPTPLLQIRWKKLQYHGQQQLISLGCARSVSHQGIHNFISVDPCVPAFPLTPSEAPPAPKSMGKKMCRMHHLQPSISTHSHAHYMSMHANTCVRAHTHAYPHNMHTHAHAYTHTDLCKPCFGGDLPLHGRFCPWCSLGMAHCSPHMLPILRKHRRKVGWKPAAVSC